MLDKKKHRLFFALWPDRAIATKLHTLAQTLVTWDDERVIPASLIHLTLRYVGNADPALQKCLEAMAQDISINQFEFTLQTLGYWKKPRVIWVAPESSLESLNNLAMKIEQGCQQCGIQAEERIFAPHITLIRKARRTPIVNIQTPLKWCATDFVLVESKSIDGGVVYEVLKRWPLLE